MNADNITVRQITEFLRKELSDYYPQSEIQQFIFLVLEDKLGYSRTDLITKSLELVDKKIFDETIRISEQLIQYNPIQYILGHTEFYGLKFKVTTDVLIPRPETEELVDWILKEKLPRNPEILDIGTGCGCIAVALAKNLLGGSIEALDISGPALEIAIENAEKNGVGIVFYLENILDPSKQIERKKYDLIVSNPPYVTKNQQEIMSRNVKDYEPHQALFAPDNDPLLFYRAILNFTNYSLKEGGWVYFEINETFSSEIADLMKNSNFADVELRKDIHEKFRMIKGRRPVKAL
jgi:release factor glutamine methyltransferase